MALNNFDKRTMKLSQVTHLQGDNRIQNVGMLGYAMLINVTYVCLLDII